MCACLWHATPWCSRPQPVAKGARRPARPTLSLTQEHHSSMERTCQTGAPLHTSHWPCLGCCLIHLIGTIFRKILVSVKFVSAILGAGNGSPNFMDTWKKCVLSAGKPVSIKVLVLGGGGILGFGGGGGKCRFYFYGRADFSDIWPELVCQFASPTESIVPSGFPNYQSASWSSPEQPVLLK